MKKRFWFSIAIVWSSLQLFPAGEVSLCVKADMHRKTGAYGECYGTSGHNFAGILSCEVLRFYRSKMILEFECDFEGKKKTVEVSHFAGIYRYDRAFRRTGCALHLRYEYNFTRDGVSIALGLQRDVESEEMDGWDGRRSHLRPTLSAAYELNLDKSARKRFLIGTRVKFLVDGRVEAGLFAGLKISFSLFRRFGG